MNTYVDHSIADLARGRHGDTVSTTGIVSRIEPKETDHGTKWATAVLTDSTGSISLNIYDEYEQHEHLLASDGVLRVSGFLMWNPDYVFELNVQEVVR